MIIQLAQTLAGTERWAISRNYTQHYIFCYVKSAYGVEQVTLLWKLSRIIKFSKYVINMPPFEARRWMSESWYAEENKQYHLYDSNFIQNHIVLISLLIIANSLTSIFLTVSGIKISLFGFPYSSRNRARSYVRTRNMFHESFHLISPEQRINMNISPDTRLLFA